MKRVLTALVLVLALGLTGTGCARRTAHRNDPPPASGPASVTTPGTGHADGTSGGTGAVDADLAEVDNLLTGTDRQLNDADRTPEDAD